MGYVFGSLDELGEGYGFRKIRRGLGVTAFGANALVTGVLQIAAAIRLRKAMTNEWLLILAGVASVVFGVLVFLFPGAGALALIWLISFYAVLQGVLLLSLAFRVRGWRSKAGLGTGRLVSEH